MFYKSFFECYANKNKTLVLFGLFFRFFSLFSFPLNCMALVSIIWLVGYNGKKRKLGHSILVDFNFNFSPSVWLSYKHYCQQCLRVIQLSELGQLQVLPLILLTCSFSKSQISWFLLHSFFGLRLPTSLGY